MITVIACTMRSSCIDNVFENYARQLWKNKQMIIILNNDNMDIELYRQRASQFPENEVRVFQLSQKYKLGKCLNYAINLAENGIIAKFDDDDYYGPKFLREAARAIKRGKASIVGKHTAFLYFKAKRALMVFRRGGEWKYSRSVKGGTLVFRKTVWNRVPFPEFKKSGTDSGWIGRCIRRGFRVYSLSKRHYVCIRRKNHNSHTQKKSTYRYMSQCRLVRKTKYYRRFVN
ncbi:glycosyltransferase family 2 protein [Paenibacillus lignilyticus]|uniref:Glycosyltransferase n=1 Tax=Paenibacillus lignilyticus TaxID=1172615 RepID=A0ABS5CAC4_9BACL|nr:glycosyltransferase [Paenibacillus lignilyticus]MBP3962949.1 glycosyltransferase [Paenibacillus lignilyticus]